MRVFQHTVDWKPSDGIGNDISGIACKIRDLGLKSYVVTPKPTDSPNFSGVSTATLGSLRDSSHRDTHILHYGGAGYPLEPFFKLRGKKILRFHNFTPSVFFQNLKDQQLSERMDRFESLTLLELASLAYQIDSVWCDSKFNQASLEIFSFPSTKVAPICKDYNNEQISKTDPKNKIDLGFVGRFAPQKKWEDLFLIFSEWKEFYPKSVLHCVGKTIPAFASYFTFLKKEVERLHLEESILFHLDWDDLQLQKSLPNWFAFVSVSEHEGFGIPILESFASRTLTVCYSCSAIPETMNNGGILLKKKDPIRTAMLLDVLKSDSQNHHQLLESQTNALKYYQSWDWDSFLRKEIGI